MLPGSVTAWRVGLSALRKRLATLSGTRAKRWRSAPAADIGRPPVWPKDGEQSREGESGPAELGDQGSGQYHGHRPARMPQGRLHGVADQTASRAGYPLGISPQLVLLVDGQPSMSQPAIG